MTRGVLLFAFNTDRVDYFKMAVATAKRANHFLKLPVSVVTDETTDLSKYDYEFDNVYIQTADKTNSKHKQIWINKGRFKAYDWSPYDETLLLDTDYVINSDRLMDAFELCADIMCPSTTSFLMHPNASQEDMSKLSFNTLWATVIVFKKTQKAQQVFECMKMVQDNYQHYANIYNFMPSMFRNDYALTVALWIVNGQTVDKSNYLPWNLVHAAEDIRIVRTTTDEYNTSYLIMTRDTTKPTYMFIKDTDFHMLHKENFMELLNV